MKLVITGALGHIGSRLIRSLPSHFPQVEITMIDNMLTQRYCSLFDLPLEGRCQFIEADVLTTDLAPAVSGAEAVIHLAAITDAAGSFENREAVELVNFNATKRTAEACSRFGIPMIHLSSTSVYGTQKDLVDENCLEADLAPQSPYAETKLKEEKFLIELGRQGGLRFVICRFGTICGVSPGMRFHTAVNKFCWQAVMGKPLTVWRTALLQKRPYLSLSDAVNAMAFIIRQDLFDQNVYNILNANLTVENIIQLIQRDIPNVEIDYVDSRIMNQLSYEVSKKRFEDRGFRYVSRIENDIRETIRLLKGARRR